MIFVFGVFGADSSSDPLLAQYRPDIVHIPTTNNVHSTGGGIRMDEAVSAMIFDPEWVQVHVICLVKPDDAAVKVKFLAAEAPCGAGGITSDANGERFASELGWRDYVTCCGGAMGYVLYLFGVLVPYHTHIHIMLNVYWNCIAGYGRGGFGVDSSNDPLLAQYQPDMARIPTTNNVHCTGGGIKMSEAIGANDI